ncbi:MAG: glycosyltransferase [Anaerolineaceae bacterium]|nr:glycosyltransferase [Anaerolineaceae bacterium]
MRVVHVIKVTGIAGAERHLLTLLPALQERGVEVHLVPLTEPDNPVADFVNALQEREVTVHPMVIRHDADIRMAWRLRDLFRQSAPDIVHTHLLHADLYGIPGAKLAGVPVIITGRHNDNAFRRRFPVRQINQGLWRLVDAGIAISDSIARFAREIEGAPAAKVHRIYYGLDFDPHAVDRNESRRALRDDLRLAPETPLVGIVCRLVEQKGLVYGLRAFSKAAAESPAHLVIAGDGPLRAALEAEAQTLGIADRVHFLGWRDDVPHLMAALDVFLLPSLWEGFGLVLLEAMAQQTPIVASAVSAIPEIVIDGQTGLLAPPRAVDGLTGALLRLLSDLPLARHLGLMGQERLETTFSARAMIEATHELYRELLKNR